MARRHGIHDHAARSHETKFPISDERCSILVEKYGFKAKDFCYLLNWELSWIDIYCEGESRPLSESIALLKEVKAAAESLAKHLAKEGDYFYRNFPPITSIHKLKYAIGGAIPYDRIIEGKGHWDGLIFRCLLVDDERTELLALNKAKRKPAEWRKLIAEWETEQVKIEALAKQIGDSPPPQLRSPYEKLEHLRAMIIPADKKLTEAVYKSAIRLFRVLDYLGSEELAELRNQQSPTAMNIPEALHWLIGVSTQAKDALEAKPYQVDEWTENNKKKPKTLIKPRLLLNLYHGCFIPCNPDKMDKIQWDGNKQTYSGTFFEFARDVFSLLRTKGEPYSKVAYIADSTLANLIKAIPNKNGK